MVISCSSGGNGARNEEIVSQSHYFLVARDAVSLQLHCVCVSQATGCAAFHALPNYREINSTQRWEISMNSTSRVVNISRWRFNPLTNWGKWANEWKIVHEPRGKVMELAWISVDQFPIGRQWEHVHRWLHSGHVWTCCLLFYYEIIFRLFLISFDRRARKMQPKDTPGALNDEKIDRPLGNFVDFLAGNYSNNLGNFF